MKTRKRPRPARPATLLALAYLSLLLLLLLAALLPAAHCREIVATDEWQLLSENDTVPAGLHVRMDLSTGEKWAKLPSDDDDESIKAASSDGRRVASAEVDGSGALSIVETAEDGNEGHDEGTVDDEGSEGAPPSAKDYVMMHRVLKKLPPDELDRFGGLPAIPEIAASTDPALVVTPERRAEFERRMEELWRARQEELRRAQEEDLADLPGMLKERRRVLHEYLLDPEGSRKRILDKRASARDGADGGEEDEEIVADDVVSALRDLEYQLADVDMARDVSRPPLCVSLFCAMLDAPPLY